MAGLLAVASAGDPPAGIEDPRIASALRGLDGRAASDDRETRIVAEVAGGRTGAVILEALGLLGAGAAIDPATLAAALFALGAAGQHDTARAVALQTLLLPNEG